MAKTAKKDQLIAAYEKLFASKRFKGKDGVAQVTKEVKDLKVEGKATEAKEEAVDDGPPKYTKSILKKGDKSTFPKKGETVYCWYTGTLEDGTVFDSNIPTSAKKKKGAKPLSFKVGVGKVKAPIHYTMLNLRKIYLMISLEVPGSFPGAYLTIWY